MVAPVLLKSRLLEGVGVPHAFSTRVGGVSAAPMDSLNFGNPGTRPAHLRDPATNIRTNIARTLEALGIGTRELVEVWQVHGADVHVVTQGAAHAGPSDTKADAVVCVDAGRAVGVRIADCAPVLVSSGNGRVVAAVHAGWRGVIAGVLPYTIEQMRSLGAGTCVAAIGPCIGARAFEVGEEVAREFRSAFGAASGVVIEPGVMGNAKPHVDLRRVLQIQLAHAGVSIDRIEQVPGCTVSEPERFFSHRRDGDDSGRLMALIGPRGR